MALVAEPSDSGELTVLRGSSLPGNWQRTGRTRPLTQQLTSTETKSISSCGTLTWLTLQCRFLSAANWGGIHLHLRGNVMGYLGVSSQFKYLRFITGRHDIPFYYDEEVAVQNSFLDAFLKGDDREGWSVPGKVPL